MTLEDPSAVWFGTDEAEPRKGNVLVLNCHHDGESHWCTPEQALARIEFILNEGKPEDEWGPRMEAMKIVPFGPWYAKTRGAGAVYGKARSEAGAVYDKARSEAWAVYDKALSEAGAVEYPAEAWAAEFKEARP